ncbi:CC157 protein, partial [Amia calva]|nr:CC157 protein [Amia calva]
MSHLLGQQDCVDSLRRDLTDLQGTILEVFSRTGPVRSPSWKFPDKLSCNLDLVTILEQYDFVEGEEEFNQHSHIVLLELVVDRLLLLLQSFNSYTEVLKGGQWSGSHSGTAGPSVSIGLVVKRCWNNLLKLGTLHKLTLQEGKHQGASTLKPADELVISRDERSGSAASIKSAKSSDVSWPLSSPQNSSQLSSGHSLLTIARDIRTMGCQTLESSLVPCDACVCSQASLREVSDTLIAVCQNQNLPSSLSRFREVMDGTLAEGHLSASDLTYWATEQSKDLARLNKHLAELLGTVQPLKESLAASEAQQGDLRGQLKRAEDILMHERGEHQKRLRELELSLEEAKAKYIEAVSKLQGEQEMLRKGEDEQKSIRKMTNKREHFSVSCLFCCV